MAGRHVNDGQASQYMTHRKEGLAVETAAAKAGFSRGGRGTEWKQVLGLPSGEVGGRGAAGGRSHPDPTHSLGSPVCRGISHQLPHGAVAVQAA